MQDFSPEFFLIDAHNFLHRNYHALPKLTTSYGLEVGALYGFVRWLLKMQRTYKPAYVAVCFDSAGGCARRKALFPDYKANRQKIDDGLIKQLDLARDLVRELGFTVVAKQGIEADDLMAFLALQAAKAQVKSVLATSDKDIYQFLNDFIHVWPSGGSEGFKGPEIAEEKFGVSASFLPDYFAMVGDLVDNVPGVAGIGPIGAVELIKKFGHLEDILRAAHNGNPEMRELLAKKILADEGNALLSKQLVVFDSDLHIPFNLGDFRVQTPTDEQLEKLFTQYEFKNLLSEKKPSSATGFMPPEQEEKPVTLPTVECMRVPLQDILRGAEDNKKIFVYCDDDFLTAGLNESTVAVVPLGEVQAWEIGGLKKIFQNDAIEKIGYDLKKTLRKLGLNLHGQNINCFDGRLARYLLNPSGDLELEKACADYFAVTVQEEDPEKLLEQYNRYSWPLQTVLTQKLRKSNQYDLFYKLELPLMMILSDMEFTGFRVDPLWLENFKVLLEKEIESCQTQIDSFAGYAVNVNSPKQLSTLLFEEMKIPPLRKTKTGYSTDESVLEEIAQTYPVARLILEYRASNKLKSTYVDNLLLQADEENKVHSCLDQAGTVTGRLASSNPNLQNIPVRTEKGRQLRHAFCAAEGNVLLSVDYSQIDLRVLAHESQDPVLIQSFLEGGDIHTQTAAQIFGVMPLMVTPEMRSSAKAINFGIIYGQGPMGLSQALNISLREAKEYIDNYFRNYRVVREWIDRNVKLARQNGYVKTMLGHVRYLPEFNMGIGSMTSFAQRAAINTIVQGGSADIIKKAMLDIFAQYKDSPVKMTMQVHDELIFELPQDLLDASVRKIKTLMQNTVQLRVPLLVSAKAGKNWYELEKLSL